MVYNRDAYKSDCPSCQACRQKVETQAPVKTHEIIAGIALASLLFTAGFPCLWVGAISLQSAYSTGYVPLFIIGWTAMIVGGLCIFGVPCACVVLYWTQIRPRNQIGYATYPHVSFGTVHRHLTEPVSDNGLSVAFRDRIGGWERTTQMSAGAGVGRIESWNGWSYSFYSGGAMTQNLGHVDILLLLTRWDSIHGTILAATVELPALSEEFQRMLVELWVLERITSKPDPLGYGKSAHGQALHERISDFLLRRGAEIGVKQRHAAIREAEEVVAELVRKKQAGL